MNKNLRLQKLKKHLLENKNLNWEEYLRRFEGAKPLELRPIEYYPRKFQIETAKWDTDISEYDIGSSPYIIRKIDQEYKITAGYKGRANKEDLRKLKT